MGRPFLPILLLCLLLVGPSVPFAWGAGITSQTISSSTASPCPNCISTNVTQIVPYSIKPGQFGQDLGFFNTSTSLAGFSWSGLAGTALTFGLPTGCLPSGILFNSSLTSLGCGTTAFYFKPQNYQSLITIRGVSTGLPVCIPISGTGGQITYNTNISSTRAQLGGSILDWSDIPASMNPAFSSSQLCYTPPIGPYSIDPLAIDGTGSCANGNSNTCNMTLTTANANDIIIVISTSESGGGVGGFALPTSTGLTFHNRVQVCAGFTCASVNAIVGMSEDYAVSTGTLSSATVTCTQTGNTNARISCVTYGISGASTTTPFDTNGALPCTGNSASTATTGSCVLSTSNANDIIIGSRVVVGTPSGNTYSGITTAAKCNAGDTAGSACSGYVVVSSTQSSLTVSISWTGAGAWAFIGDALQQAASAVTQGIKITTLTAGAPSCSIGISGGGASNSSFTADGSTHSYSLSASATITLTVTTGANARCAWNVSPHPTYSATITFTTCASGTCSTYSNNSYWQLGSIYEATPLTPSTWDGIYTWGITGTYLGSSSHSQSCPNTTSGGSTVVCGPTASLPVLDGTVTSNLSCISSCGINREGTISTMYAPELIVISASTQNTQVTTCTGLTAPPTISSVTASGLTFHLRQSIQGTATVASGVCFWPYTSEWYARPNTTLSSLVVRIQASGIPNSDFAVIINSWANINPTQPFDPNAGASCNAKGTAATVTCNVSTSYTDDAIIGGMAVDNAPLTPGAGFTHIAANDITDTEFQTVTSTQSGLAVDWTGSSSGEPWVILGDAVQGVGYAYFDYNLPVSTQTRIGNTWVAQAPSSFTDITGGNSHLVNYIQSSGTGGAITITEWMLTIPFFLVGIVLLGKRRRLRI